MKKIKGKQIEMEELKVSLFADDNSICKRLQSHHQKIPTAAKHIQQGSRVQN